MWIDSRRDSLAFAECIVVSHLGHFRGDGVAQLVERQTRDPKHLRSEPRQKIKICESFSESKMLC